MKIKDSQKEGKKKIINSPFPKKSKNSQKKAVNSQHIVKYERNFKPIKGNDWVYKR